MIGLGQDLWEVLVDNTLWNMACEYLSYITGCSSTNFIVGAAGSMEPPEFPWKDPSETAGGESETYMHLKILRRAEVEADEFLDRLAQRLAQREAGAQSGEDPEAQG